MPCRAANGSWPVDLTGHDDFLIDELGAEFATDPPCQPALTWAAFRQNDGELGGTSTYSAMTFTPPSDMSVIVQSRGKPVPNWILASRPAQTAFALRRFTSMSIPSCLIMVHPAFLLVVEKNYWNLPSGTSRNVTIPFEVFLPNPQDLSPLLGRIADFPRARASPTRSKPPAHIAGDLAARACSAHESRTG